MSLPELSSESKGQSSHPPALIFVVPCYNEEAVLRGTAQALAQEISKLAALRLCRLDDSGILFVDDGSRDATWSLILKLAATSDLFNGISLSRNKGHQSALIAGLEVSRRLAEVSISIDADLQDDIAVCKDMLSLYLQGHDIVYGVRADRRSDSPSKRFFASSFYALMSFIGVDIVPGHADFRLISRRAIDQLMRYGERSLFLRGIIPQLGYRTAMVYYERKARQAGASKYPFRKSLSLAVDGVISFSTKPLRLITYMGLGMVLVAALLLLWTLYEFALGRVIPGWTSLMVMIVVIGGAQLLALSIIGEYIGRAYRELQHRPRYHIDQICGTLMQPLTEDPPAWTTRLSSTELSGGF